MRIRSRQNNMRKASARLSCGVVLYAGIAAGCIALDSGKAQGAEPFQIRAGDLRTDRLAHTAEPAPFQVLESDLNTRTTVYSGTQSAGDAQITNNSGEQLQFRDGSTASSAGIINNTGGAADFHDQSTAASAFITNNADARLSFNQNATAADARITNNGAGVLLFNDEASAGDAVITNNGTATFNGHSSADNALITNNATGQIDFNDQAQAGRRNIYNNGQIRFNGQSSAQNSQIENNQTGRISFSGDSSSTNAMVNNSGGLEFTDAATAGQTAIINNQTGSIAFSGTSNAADATITNNGSVSFSGESHARDARLINNAGSALAFREQSGADASMIVNAGDLTFSDRSSAGSATILTSEGGVVRFQDQADGASASLHIDQKSALDARLLSTQHLSLGSLTNAGDINLGRTVLNVQNKAVLNDTSRMNLVLGYGQLIANDVELQNGMLAITRADDFLYALGETYEIVSGATFSGSGFSSAVAHDFAFVDLRLNAPGTAITLDRNDVRFEAVAETRNQRSVGAAIESMEQSASVYRAIISSSRPQAMDGFDQLSGEIHATLIGTIPDQSNQFRMNLLENADRAAVTSLGGFRPWRSWLAASGSTYTYDGDALSAKSELTGYSITGGFDRAIADGFALGFAGIYEQNTLKMSARASSADIRTFGGGIYSGWQYGDFGLRGGATYQHHAIDTRRGITLSALNGSLQSDYNAWTGQIFAEAGYNIGLAGFQVEPYLGVSYLRSRFDGFAEYGLGDAALSGPSQTADNALGMAGLRINKRFDLNNNFRMDTRFAVEWNRAFNEYRRVRYLSFNSGLPFETAGSDVGRDSAALRAQLSFSRSDSLEFGAFYNGLIGKNKNGHRFGANATVRFGTDTPRTWDR